MTESRVDWSDPNARYIERVGFIADHLRLCAHCRRPNSWPSPCGILPLLIGYVDEARDRMASTPRSR